DDKSVKTDAPVDEAYNDEAPVEITKDGKVYVLSTTAPVRQNDGDAPTNGTVTEETQTITYQYVLKTTEKVDTVTKEGNVVVHYVDESGNVIKDQVTDTPTSDVKTPYDTTDNKPSTIEFNGKTYELVPTKTIGQESGEVVEGTTEVTYVYKLKATPVTPVETPKGNVVVHYVDESGNVIKTPVTDTPTSDVKTPYDTTDNKPSTIEFNGKTYEIVIEKTVGTEKGEVSEGTTVITYVYRELVAQVPETPASPETPAQATPVALGQKTWTNTTRQTPAPAKANYQASLPSTGEEESVVTLVGSAILAATALGGFASKRRKKQD
ncbi:MucBP domain-containing protein, partial [Streptococcus saliviloxodontae]|uniref:MucBP domain-containing protein n=1 Tax=Streptococcus saliviloxodontae TaxID=1349416 RepID=UPI003643DABD